MNRRLASIFVQVKAHPYRVALAVLPLLAVAVVLMVPNIASASALENATLSLMNTIFSFFMYIFGNLLVLFTDVLIYIATYANITDVEAVKVGWAVVRDLANMGFIVAMLLISFGTIFRFQEYRYSRLLGKLVIMAILINFSRLIASLLVDFSQVIMLTFVNAFRDLAAGNITAGFGVEKIVAFSQNASALGGDINLLSVLGAMFAGIVMLFIATAIVASFVVFLVQRMIMLWIYIILSPLAYMMAVLPGSLGRFWGGWWETFMKYLIRGPVIGFYLWLAFTIASFTNTTFDSGSVTQSVDPLGTNSGVSTSSVAYFANQASTGASVLNYVVFAALLIAGLQQAAAAGGVAGKIAGKAMGTFENWGSSLAKSPFKVAGAIARRPAYAAAESTLNFAGKIPLVGGFARNANAKLRRSRIKREEKGAELTNYMTLDEKMRELKSTSNPLSMAAIGRKRNIRENILKGQDFGKLGATDKRKLLEDARKDAGMDWYENSDGSKKPTYADNSIGSAIENVESADPTLLAKDIASHAAGSAERLHYEKKVTKAAQNASPIDIGKWNADALRSDPVLAKLVFDQLAKRADDPRSRFVEQLNLNAMGSKADLEAAYGDYVLAGGIRTPRGTLFQQDIDMDRQRRTADRIAKYSEKGLNFHESEEYMKNQGSFYDLKSFNVNEAQEARRAERENLKKQGIYLPVTGTGGFATGKENTLAFSEEFLKESGQELTAAGNISEDPAEVKKFAAYAAQRISKDISEIESQLLNTPESVLDTMQEGSTATLRKRLEIQRNNLRGTQQRLVNGDLDGISFINADRHGGSVRNAKTEERFHNSLKAMDNDGSFRNELWSSLAPAEQQQIVEEMRVKTNKPEMEANEAFNEYLAKGLTNLTRGTWADTAPDAVKLKSGLALQVKAQAEKHSVVMPTLSLLREEPGTINTPGKVSSTAASFQAASRAVSAGTANAAQRVSEKARGVAGKVGEVVAGPLRRRQANKAIGAQVGIGEKVGGLEWDRGQLQQAEAEAAEERRVLERVKAKNAQEAGLLQAQYQDQDAVRKTTKNPLEARVAAEKMNALRKEIALKAKAVEEQEANVAKAEQAAQKVRDKIAKTTSEAYGAEVQQAEKVTKAAPRVAQTRSVGMSNETAPSAASENVEETSSGAGTTNITNNVRNEITQVIKSAPQGFRDTMKLTSTSLDSAMRSSLVMKSLMTNLRNGFEAIQKSDKNLSAETTGYLGKRLSNLQKHVDGNDVEGFREDFGKLQKEFESIIE